MHIVHTAYSSIHRCICKYTHRPTHTQNIGAIFSEWSLCWIANLTRSSYFHLRRLRATIRSVSSHLVTSIAWPCLRLLSNGLLQFSSGWSVGQLLPSTLLTGEPSASFRSLKTALFSLGLLLWKRF